MLCYCINLNNQKAKWERAQREIQKFGLVAERFPAIKVHDQPRLGCLRSHQAVIRKAKELNLDQVMIFEDDVMAIGDYKKYFHAALSQLPVNFDLFYLGVRPGTLKKKFSENLILIASSKLSHAVLVNHTVYDIILASKEQSFDRCNVTAVHPRGLSFCTWPCIAIQGDKADALREFNDAVRAL